MAIFSNYWKTRVVRIPAFAIGLTVALTTTGLNLLRPADWAGWVQALGACIGIGIAIYVPSKQNQIQRAREAERELSEISAILKSVGSEVRALRKNLEDNAGAALRNIKKGTGFRTEIGFQENPFFVYSAVAGKLGALADDDLRNLIIETYAASMSFIVAVKHNNELIEKDAYGEGIGARSNDAHFQNIQKYARARLDGHSIVVSLSYKRMEAKIDALLQKLG